MKYAVMGLDASAQGGQLGPREVMFHGEHVFSSGGQPFWASHGTEYSRRINSNIDRIR